MKLTRCFAGFLFYLLAAISLNGQAPYTITESSLIFGIPVKHTPELLFERTGPSYGFRIAHHWQTIGKKDWQVRHHYPRIGLAAYWLRIGEPEILGSSFSITPEISFGLITLDRYEMRGTAGYGLGFLTKTFDYQENPTNNAISAPLNVSVLLKLDQAIRLHPQWYLQGSIALSHFSNGARHLPNFGINIVNFELGLQFRNKAFEKDTWNTEREDHQRVSNWAIDLQAGMGYREREESRGPAYPIYNLTGALAYHITPVQTMRLGFSWEKNRGAYVFGKHIILFDSEEEARLKSQRRMLFYAHEFRFGAFGVNIWMGTYLARKKTALLAGPVFNTIEIRYYFPALQRLALNPYVSFDMKSHSTRAEYISLRIGAVIGK